MGVRSIYILALTLATGAIARAWGPKPWHGPHSACGYPGGGPTATIDSGVVVGTTTSLPTATATVNKFLGVPFAKSPPTRFAPPESPGTFGEPIIAKEWSPACIQQFVYPKESAEFVEAVFNNPPPEESEDCLYAQKTDCVLFPLG
jgi:acetylcholinesterase